jgi:serine protease Do
MTVRSLRSRWGWPALSVLLVLGLIAAAPQLGHTTSNAVWTDRPVNAPRAETVPNWVEIAKILKPAVVNVSTRRPAQAEDVFQHFQGPGPGSQGSHSERSLGSGFIINPAGYIVTNNHVVDGATEIKVKLSDGRELAGRLLGRDPKTDIALLRIEADNLPSIPPGDSAALQVGEPVMAIGNPFGLEQTVTTGIVSATGRVIGEGPYDDFIQTDASINPGNSGGPLINARGQAVGINTAIVSRTGGSVGIGFAIPINAARTVVAQLADSGHVTRGWLGVKIQRLTPELAKSFGVATSSGALVTDVMPDSPAAKAAVKRGDVIVQYNGRPIGKLDEVPRMVADTPVGQTVTLEVIRDGKPMKLNATIARLEESEQHAKASTSDDSHPTLGLAVESLTPSLAHQAGLDDTRGVLVRDVRDGGAAAAAGLQAGDVIVEVDHRPVASTSDLRGAIDRHAKGTPILMLVHREGETFYVAVAA